MAYPHPAPFVRVSFGSPSLALDARRLQPFHCHSQPKSSSQWLEKSGILYVHIYLPATGLLQLAGPPPPQSLLNLSFAGGVNWRVGRDGLQRGRGARWGYPPGPREENGISLHLLRDKASSRSQRSIKGTQERFPSLSCQVFTFPL